MFFLSGPSAAGSLKELASLVGGEALAYVRLGMLAPGHRRVKKQHRGRADVAVLFVPGLGANGGNFMPMRRQLESDVDLFDTFDYFSLRDPRLVARRLKVRLQALSARADRLYCVGHSLGGLLLRMVLQGSPPIRGVAGFAALCSPLHGTWRSKLAPAPLRQLTPDSELMSEVLASAHRLEPLQDRVLTVAARHDPFIKPHTSALLDIGPQLLLDDVGHNGALLDRRVHEAVHRLIRA